MSSTERPWMKKSSTVQEIGEWILECDEPVTLAQIREAFDDVPNPSAALSRLCKEGRIARVGRALYAAPQEDDGHDPEPSEIEEEAPTPRAPVTVSQDEESESEIPEHVFDLVRLWARRLHLAGWLFKIQMCELDDGAVASMNSDARYMHGVLFLTEEALALDAEELEHIVIHELLHASHEAIDAFVTARLSALYGPGIAAQFVEVYSDHMEPFIQRTAKALAAASWG